MPGMEGSILPEYPQIEVIPPTDCRNLKSPTLGGSLSDIASNSTLDVNEYNAKNNQVKIYSTPTNELIISLPLSQEGYILTILSIDGKILKKYKLNDTDYNIDLSAFNCAFLIINVKNNKQTFTTKIIR